MNEFRPIAFCRKSILYIAAFVAMVQTAPVCLAASSDSPEGISVEDLGKSHSPAQRKAKDALLQGGSSSVPTLLHGLDSSNQDVKIQALTILQEIKLRVRTLADDQIADYIGKKAAGDPDVLTRVHMVNTLGMLKGPNATRELKRLAAQDPDMYLRAAAMQKISDTSAADESAFFRTRLRDSKEVVQLAAYLELARFGDSSGRAVALQVLQRSPTNTRSPFELEMAREEAIAILGYVANPSDFNRLKELFESKAESKTCQMSAFHSYHRAQLLRLPADQRLDYLIKALDDKPSVRLWAYGELYHSRDSRTNSRLKQYLKESGHQGYKEAADALSAR